MSKWTYEIEVDRDIWRGGVFETKEEAIKEGDIMAILDGKETFKIGMVEEINHGICVDQVLEDIKSGMYDEVGEVAECYLDDVTNKHRLILEEALNTIFFEWQQKYKYEPTFYRVISEEIIEVVKEV